MKYAQFRRFFILMSISGILILGLSQRGFSQCEPDLVSCVDVDEPGQMCPSVLPDGFVDEYYEQIITVLTPKSGNVGGLNINVHKLKLESIENLPAGIDYQTTTDEFYADEAYCVSLTGTPLAIGTYNLKITVIPYVLFLGIPVKWGVYVDSTSIVMHVGNSTFSDPLSSQDFSLINAYPNPFSSGTRVGFVGKDEKDVELRVFNMLGRQLYYEKVVSTIGDNYFDFAGYELEPGYYLYAIIREEKVLNGRLIKNR